MKSIAVVLALVLVGLIEHTVTGSTWGSGWAEGPWNKQRLFGRNVNCKVSLWSNWSDYSVPGGIRTRSRTVNVPPTGRGGPCPPLTIRDIDECYLKTDKCSVNAGCSNTPGSYNCKCLTGFNGDGFRCTDVDECYLKTDNCAVNAGCSNTPGSYNCKCLTGFNGDGFTCYDVDECDLKTDKCSVNAGCVNTGGSYNCKSLTGFNGDGFTCRDVNECYLKTDNCAVEAGCANTPGSYNCTCFTRFHGDGFTCYVFIECGLKTDTCSENARCVSTLGGPYNKTCACFTGFIGDGSTCTDVDECDLKTDNCSVNARCVNTPGSFNCTCRTGFNGDGFTCSDVDECYLKTNNCSVNAVCANTPGSYLCTCSLGFNGDGLTCTGSLGLTASEQVTASVFGTIGVVTVLIGLCLCCLWNHRKRRLRMKRLRNNKKNLGIELKPTGKSGLEIGSLLKKILDPESQMTIHSMLIHPDKIEKSRQIGKGAFGTVFYGRYRPDKNPLHVQEVAIKSLKDSCIYPEIIAFMQEAIIMSDCRHPNVLNILGICVDQRVEIPALVLPFMLHGDLQKYLRSFRYDKDKVNKTPELVQLLSFSLQIAKGMEYLSSRKFVHRDLSARNCMLSEQMLVKVADFGLARDIYSSSYYRQEKHKPLPIKWMAIESFKDRVFNTNTDVWSYGVTLWEVFSLGKAPYPYLDNADVLPALMDGQRLDKPDTCPDKLFEITKKCWAVNPKDRPTFTDLVKVVDAALTSMSDYLDLDGSSAANAIDFTTGVVSSPRELAITESGSAVTRREEILYITSD